MSKDSRCHPGSQPESPRNNLEKAEEQLEEATVTQTLLYPEKQGKELDTSEKEGHSLSQDALVSGAPHSHGKGTQIEPERLRKSAPFYSLQT